MHHWSVGDHFRAFLSSSEKTTIFIFLPKLSYTIDSIYKDTLSDDLCFFYRVFKTLLLVRFILICQNLEKRQKNLHLCIFFIFSISKNGVLGIIPVSSRVFIGDQENPKQTRNFWLAEKQTSKFLAWEKTNQSGNFFTTKKTNQTGNILARKNQTKPRKKSALPTPGSHLIQ